MELSYMSKLPVEVDLSQFTSWLNERLTGLENQLASVETSVNERIESVSTDLSSQLGTVETSVNERIESVSTDLTYRLETVESRASSNEAEIASVRNSVQNLPSRGYFIAVPLTNTDVISRSKKMHLLMLSLEAQF